MNVHVFTNTSVLDLNTLRTRASLLVGDATFVDGWRAVPLPPTDSLPDHPPDTTALDDFVHYIHDLDNSSFQILPSPDQPRTLSDPNHSPATFLSQTRPASYGQQRVGQQTLFDESVSRTRQSDAPGSSSIYAMSGQLSIHTADISARNVLSPSARISSNAVQSIPVPPNQLELYPHQPSLHSMQSANQDSLYGSHELRDNGQSSANLSSYMRVSLLLTRRCSLSSVWISTVVTRQPVHPRSCHSLSLTTRSYSLQPSRSPATSFYFATRCARQRRELWLLNHDSTKSSSAKCEPFLQPPG